MKKLISLLLMVLLLISICACGANGNKEPERQEETKPTESETVSSNEQNNEQNDNETEETNEQEDESDNTVEVEEAVIAGTEVSIGDTIETDCARITFTDAKIDKRVGTDDAFIPASEGMRFFIISGTIENTSGKTIDVTNAFAEIIFNDEYTYNAYFVYGEWLETSIPALASGPMYLCATIPEALLEKMTSGVALISTNDGFATKPISFEAGNYRYQIALPEEICGQSQNTSYEMVYFEECPILPTPESYADMFQSSRSSNSTNGKVRNISYGFTSYDPVDMEELCRAYIEELEKLGFSVSHAAGEYTIYSGQVKIAVVSINASSLAINLVPGNEDVEAPIPGSSESIPTETVLKIGDTIVADTVQISLEKTGESEEILDGSKQWSLTSDDGNPYFWVSGSLTNTGSAPIDLDNIFLQFTFDDQYSYHGDSTGYIENGKGFLRDLSAQSDCIYIFYAAVPQRVLDSYEKCTVKIGFTNEFDYVTLTNGLPNFDYCDNVYLLDCSK